MTNQTIYSDQIRVRISGPIPYADDDQMFSVWEDQLIEHVTREMDRMQSVLALLYPQMTVEVY